MLNIYVNKIHALVRTVEISKEESKFVGGEQWLESRSGEQIMCHSPHLSQIFFQNQSKKGIIKEI